MRKSLLVLIICAFTVTLFGQWEEFDIGSSDNLYGLYFTNSTTGHAVSYSWQNVYKTTNAGESWNHSVIASGAYLFGIHFTDELNGYIAGYYGGAVIFRTINGGNTWSPQPYSGCLGFYEIEFATSQIGYVCGYSGRIRKTTNGGNSWSNCTTGTGETFRWMDILDENTGYAVSGTSWNNSRKLFKMTNGNNWSMIYDFGVSTVIEGMHFFDENTGVAVGKTSNHGVIYKTYDGGINWEEKVNDTNGTFFRTLNFNGDRGFAGNQTGDIFQTNDAGETWEEESIPNAEVNLTAFDNGDYVFIGGSPGVVFRKLLEELSTENDILSFTIPQQIDDTVIDNAAHTVHVNVPEGTNVTALTPSIEISDYATINPESGTPQDFTEPVEYTVTSENSDEQIWTVTVSLVTSSENNLPDSIIELNKNYPNPFNPSTTISFNLTAENAEGAKISIYNLRGQKIKKFDIRNLKLGMNKIDWNGDDENGNTVSSGIYLYKLKYGNYTSTKKMILMK